MTATRAIIGYGTTVAVGDTGSPPIYTQLAEVTEVTPPNAQTDDVEATHFISDSRTREYIPGLIEPGEASVGMNRIPGSTTEILLMGLQQAGTRVPVLITWPNGTTWQFLGVVKGYETASPIDDRMAIASQYGGDSVSYWMIYVDQNGSVYFHQVINGIAYYTGGPSVITTATWFHIAVVRSGNSQRLYINGVGGPVEPTHLQADIAGSLEIGVWAGGGYFLNGYLDEVRFANYARWPITSNFTPPTAADTALASDLRLYNKLLLNFEGDLTDASPAARGSGTPNVAFNYNPGTGYFGSYSGYFNGSNQYVLFGDSDDFDFGAGDFSIDFFEYRVAAINGSAVLARDTSVASQAFLLGHGPVIGTADYAAGAVIDSEAPITHEIIALEDNSRIVNIVKVYDRLP